MSLVIEDSMIQNEASLAVDNVVDQISIGIDWWMAKYKYSHCWARDVLRAVMCSTTNNERAAARAKE